MYSQSLLTSEGGRVVRSHSMNANIKGGGVEVWISMPATIRGTREYIYSQVLRTSFMGGGGTSKQRVEAYNKLIKQRRLFLLRNAENQGGTFSSC
jgi:hypothetical protein